MTGVLRRFDQAMKLSEYQHHVVALHGDRRAAGIVSDLNNIALRISSHQLTATCLPEWSLSVHSTVNPLRGLVGQAKIHYVF
jgi:hypothetical protein